MQPDDKILARLGVSKLRKSQSDIIEHILEGSHDLLAVLPTGGGKTLCFQYASIAFSGTTIIIYPLLSLMKDQEMRFKRASIPCVTLKGGQTKRERRDIFNKIESGKVKVIITNPETLVQKGIVDKLSLLGDVNIVADECHTIIEWGMSFRGKMLELKSVFERLRINKILAFTATLSQEVEKGLLKYLFINREYDRVYYSANRENIEYSYIRTPSPSHSLYELLKNVQKPCIVFANDRMLCQRTVGFIERFLPEIESYYYHAGLSKTRKAEVEKWFYRSESGVLVATCAFGMGVDKANIRSVIHLRLPENVSAFLQESGRAGRDGKKAFSYAIISQSEEKTHKSSARQALFNCFDKNLCIRKALLRSLGESGVEKIMCTGCVSCHEKSTDDKYYPLILKIVQKYAKAMSLDDIVLILKGVEVSNIPFCRKLSFFGIFKGLHIAFIDEYVISAFHTIKDERAKITKFFKFYYNTTNKCPARL